MVRRKAITEGAQPDNRAQFNRKIVRLLHQETWKTTQGTEREDLTLSPAGKFVPWTVRQIYENLDEEKCPTDQQPDRVKVEGVYFENHARCCDARRELAKKYLQILLRNEQGKRDPASPARRRGKKKRGSFSVKERDLAIAGLRQLVRG
jgi:hypothetical protein